MLNANEAPNDSQLFIRFPRPAGFGRGPPDAVVGKGSMPVQSPQAFAAHKSSITIIT
jgi:hypothetical protein